MTATMVSIRRSTQRDGQRAMEIWRNAVDATHDFLEPADRLAIERELVGFLPSAPLWLSVDAEDRATGFMLLDGAHMEALFVDPLHAGHGIGRALVEHAASSCAVLTTDVNEQNGQAVSFYRHLGFEPTGRSAIDGQGRPYPLIHLRRTA